jgi:excisionase family DNA binding protein
MDAALTVPEVARRLGIPGPDVYRLIENGELRAGKGADGLVYVPEEALAEYGQDHAAPSR